jgi:hypothetical protein
MLSVLAGAIENWEAQDAVIRLLIVNDQSTLAAPA